VVKPSSALHVDVRVPEEVNPASQAKTHVAEPWAPTSLHADDAEIITPSAKWIGVAQVEAVHVTVVNVPLAWHVASAEPL